MTRFVLYCNPFLCLQKISFERYFVYSMLTQNTFMAKNSIIIQIMRNFAAYKI